MKKVCVLMGMLLLVVAPMEAKRKARNYRAKKMMRVEEPKKGACPVRPMLNKKTGQEDIKNFGGKSV